MDVHVVSKKDNAQHATFPLQAGSWPNIDLPPSSIRVRTVFVGLTSNNLSYARGGHFLHWWDTYPVPGSSPAPYNDTSSWGIVPAWGYGVVVESTTSIAQGTIMWGFWPTATGPTDLKLKATEPKGQWIEISEHRQELMHIYNRYAEQPNLSVSLSTLDLTKGELDEMVWHSLFRGSWEGAYLLSQHVFSPSPQTQTPVHPLGMGMGWTTEDADLSSAIVVSLSASGKAARSFAYHLSHRPASAGPLGLLQFTSSPSPISEAAENLQSFYPTKTLAYSEVSESLDWVVGLKASKIVIVDFGARDKVLEELLDSVKKHSEFQFSQVVIIQVGNQQKVYTDEEVLASRDDISRLGKVQYNTSGVQDAVVELNGAEAYHDTVNKEWEAWYRSRHRHAPDIRVVCGEGFAGEGGIEGGWTRLSRGEVGADEGLVYWT
ncbi:MAG: hypothetical protein M1833_000434 [Piccolia ochrophora]|nr:MAG: hypothetical protein M1833_000434 [Piccolia ochrophora]